MTWAPTASNRLGNWELTLGLRNVGNERYIASGFENPGIGFSLANFNRPREWFLSFRFRR
ncbi:hypothetical protein D3C83_152990 [compost metagenome]